MSCLVQAAVDSAAKLWAVSPAGKDPLANDPFLVSSGGSAGGASAVKVRAPA